MATQVTQPPSGSEVVKNGTSNPRPLQLAQFLSGLTADQEFQRTADYARDPKKYLQNALGHETFDKRKDLLCIPDKVDKDIYGGGEHKTHFQQHIANLFGKSHGLFFLTGVQAQLAALKIHCDHANNNGVAWHITSHLEFAEGDAYDVLYGLNRRLIGSTEKENPTVEEIKEVLALPDDQRPAAIVIEIPNRVLGCKTFSFAELQTISSSCREAGVKFHGDGARIWEIEPYYQKTAGKTFADIADLFDSVYVSFYKGLRGASGAMLLSNDESVISVARKWQRRAGGNSFTLAYEVIDCERGYNENIGTFPEKWKKMRDVCEGVVSSTARFKTADGQPVVSFLSEEPTCCQTRTVFQGYTVDEMLAARDRVVEKTNVQVFERMPPKKSDAEKTNSDVPQEPGEVLDRRQVMEWMIVPALVTWRRRSSLMHM